MDRCTASARATAAANAGAVVAGAVADAPVRPAVAVHGVTIHGGRAAAVEAEQNAGDMRRGRDGEFWKRLPPHIADRSGHSLVLFRDRALIFGGQRRDGGKRTVSAA